jgi:hypothetical protein
VGVGLASVNWGVTQGVASSAAAPGWMGLLYSNSIRSGNVTVGSGALSYVAGDTIGIAYDCAANRIWWNKNNGTWYGQGPTAGDPVGGTQGFVFNSSTWPMTIAAMTGTGTAATFTVRDTAGALKYTLPTGYSAWSPATFPVVSTQGARVMVLA